MNKKGRRNASAQKANPQISTSNKKQLVIFNLTQETIGGLKYIIQQSLSLGTNLHVLSTLDLNYPEEMDLCEIPEIKDLFLRASVEHGLLGYYSYTNKL